MAASPAHKQDSLCGQQLFNDSLTYQEDALHSSVTRLRSDSHFMRRYFLMFRAPSIDAPGPCWRSSCQFGSAWTLTEQLRRGAVFPVSSLYPVLSYGMGQS